MVRISRTDTTGCPLPVSKHSENYSLRYQRRPTRPVVSVTVWESKMDRSVYPNVEERGGSTCTTFAPVTTGAENRKRE